MLIKNTADVTVHYQFSRSEDLVYESAPPARESKVRGNLEVLAPLVAVAEDQPLIIQGGRPAGSLRP